MAGFEVTPHGRFCTDPRGSIPSSSISIVNCTMSKESNTDDASIPSVTTGTYSSSGHEQNRRVRNRPCSKCLVDAVIIHVDFHFSDIRLHVHLEILSRSFYCSRL